MIPVAYMIEHESSISPTSSLILTELDFFNVAFSLLYMKSDQKNPLKLRNRPRRLANFYRNNFAIGLFIIFYLFSLIERYFYEE